MEAKLNIILNGGYDIDGVIAKSVISGSDKFSNIIYNSDRILKGGVSFWDKIFSSPFGKFLYNKLRRINKETRKAIIELRARGHRIVIVTYISEKHRDQVEGWLIKNRVPFDALILAKEGESAVRLKIRAIKEEKLDYFIEDQRPLITEVAKEVPNVKMIYYRGRKDLDILFKGA